MKIQKPQKLNKPLLISIVVLLLTSTVCLLYYLYHNNVFQNQSIQPSVESSHETEDTPEKSSPSSDDNPERESEKTPLQTIEKPSPQSVNDTLSGTISYKNVYNNQLILRVTVNQVLSSGSCTLILQRGDRLVTKNSEIMQNPSSSSCAGFDVPTSELSTGIWNITVTITSGSKTGKVTETVSI